MSELATLARPREGVALVTMNFSEWGGFVSAKAAGALADALAEAREGGARVSILASALPGHWYKHAWLPDLCNMVEGKPASADAKGWYRALDEIAGKRVVTIAAISGDCCGGGAELGWACDLRIAEEQARFGQPEVMLGLATGIGGTSRLTRLIGRTVTAEMVLDGSPMTAERIYELGGINRVVAQGSAVDVALRWASRLADRDPGALGLLKQILIDNDDRDLTEALRSEQARFQETAGRKAALATMRKTQDRFDAGESLREVYGQPRS